MFAVRIIHRDIHIDPFSQYSLCNVEFSRNLPRLWGQRGLANFVI